MAAGSRLIFQNPAGWLRRAIEEDYTLPKPFERHQQRSGREKKHATLTQAKSREQHTPNVVTLNRENMPEKKEAEKTDQRENQATWNKALEQLKIDLPQEEVAARLSGTTLLQVTETAARIGVANPFAIPWLERRLYGQIAKAMKAVVGRDVDLQFIAAS